MNQKPSSAMIKDKDFKILKQKLFFESLLTTQFCFIYRTSNPHKTNPRNCKLDICLQILRLKVRNRLRIEITQEGVSLFKEKEVQNCLDLFKLV